MDVRIFCGANAYACISDNGRQTDIRLSPGKSAQASLREYAAQEQERAARIMEMADRARRAAIILERQDNRRFYESCLSQSPKWLASCLANPPALWRPIHHRIARLALKRTRGSSDYIIAGETLWNGARVTHCLAMAYNRLSDRIAAFEREGRRPPESLLNGRHKLIAQAI